jgi:Ser/Thr protein kinase RdoA (MazF antagonist)
MTVCDGFWDLNRSQQSRRLTALARAALARYRLGAVALEPLHYNSNAIFRATRLRDGKRFVLRIHSPETPKAHVRSELLWLAALKADGFTVPYAIPACDGAALVAVAAPHVPEARVCTLLTWIEGRIARQRQTPEQLRRVGRQIARLHRHASDFAAPRGFTRPRWDPDSLLDGGSWQAGWQRLTSYQFRVMREIADRFQAVASDLGQGNRVFGLIHADFTFENVLFYGDDVRVIDFGDCGCGYFLYDLATLLDRIEWRTDYRDLRAALLAGYREERELRPEDEGLLDLFLLVRWSFLGLAFLSAPDHSPGRNYSDMFLKIVIPKMRKYLRTV